MCIYRPQEINKMNKESLKTTVKTISLKQVHVIGSNSIHKELKMVKNIADKRIYLLIKFIEIQVVCLLCTWKILVFVGHSKLGHLNEKRRKIGRGSWPSKVYGKEHAQVIGQCLFHLLWPAILKEGMEKCSALENHGNERVLMQSTAIPGLYRYYYLISKVYLREDQLFLFSKPTTLKSILEPLHFMPRI